MVAGTGLLSPGVSPRGGAAAGASRTGGSAKPLLPRCHRARFVPANGRGGGEGKMAKMARRRSASGVGAGHRAPLSGKAVALLGGAGLEVSGSGAAFFPHLGVSGLFQRKPAAAGRFLAA